MVAGSNPVPPTVGFSSRTVRVSMYRLVPYEGCSFAGVYHEAKGIWSLSHQEQENGKVYVGSTIDLALRWATHKTNLRRGRHANSHLQFAWQKYGEEAFDFLVLRLVVPDKLSDEEQRFFALFQATDPSKGYNICLNARNSLGVKRSPETKAKLSAWRTGRKSPPGTGAKISAAHMGKVYRKGFTLSQETKDKIGAALRGRVFSEEHKRKISEATKGKTYSESTKSKISASLTGKKATPEARAKMSAARTGVPHPCRNSRPAKHVDLVCALCGETFSRLAREENMHKKDRKTGPYCSPSCRNKMAAKCRHYGHSCAVQ